MAGYLRAMKALTDAHPEAVTADFVAAVFDLGNQIARARGGGGGGEDQQQQPQ